MIQILGTSFGYGVQVGTTYILRERALFDSSPDMQDSAVVLPFLPSADEFTRMASGSGVEFFIIPLCSSYSHLAASIWANGVPVVAIEQPQELPEGAYVLADFEEGLLLVAEEISEAEELRVRALETQVTRKSQTTGLMTRDRSRASVAILAEASSAEDILQALVDGADGIGVVKSEQLFPGASSDNSEVEALIRVVKANPHVLPLKVRFFDSYPKETDEDALGRFDVPDGYLGYRGVRILEVDITWLQRFQARLKMLDLEQIIVILPMVTLLSEVQQIRERLDRRWNRIGITVETPAAALRIEELLDVSDFIEIGLNDLTQYTMAWDRDIPHQERLPTDHIVDPVADLIATVAAACNAAEVPYTLGMDLRPSTRLAAQIMQLGVTSISCVPPLVKPWRDAIIGCST